MAFIDVLSLILSLGVLYSLRLLLPRNIVPRVSKSFEEAVKSLQRAEAVNIPYVSEYQTNLAFQHSRFIHMRTDSHSSPGFLHQLYLLFFHGLSWRLYDLKSRVDAIRRCIELAEDERQLAYGRQLPFLTNTNAQSATTTALPASPADTIIPITDVTEPTPPPRAVRRRAYH
jgi:hypothetical protein